MPALEISDVIVNYGGVRALDGVSLAVEAGQCSAILGANGAGKSSLMRAISGLVPYSGVVEIDGKPARGGASRVARAGVGHVLEGRHVFTQLTVLENLLVGGVGSRKARTERMAAILDTFPVLKLKLHKHGGELSGGEQQTVAIGRCLMGAPKILLMDEPSLGLAPRVIAQLAEAISNVRAEWGTTLLVAEQSIGLAVSLASRCHVLQRGRVVYSGPPDQDVLHEEVRRAYLGGSAEQ